MSTTWAIVVSLVLLAANAFFVAAEFALVASKRYRLEHAAAEGSRAARSALEGTRELSLMLAGAQLGITLCSLGLGALAEPALEHLISPPLEALGVPEVPSHVVAFIVALIIVTFLHLVIGEMMPKSWAITHPERSATLLALPFRGFARVVRPGLNALNNFSNWVLRLFGVEPVDQLAQAHGPQEMNILLERSEAEGSIGAEQAALLTSMLRLQEKTVLDVLIPADQLVTVPPDAGALDIEAASLRSGRSRLAVIGADGAVAGVVHVRDAVRAGVRSGTDDAQPAGVQPGGVQPGGVQPGGVQPDGAQPGGVQPRGAVTAADLMDAPFVLDASVTVTDAVTQMRANRAQLAMVTGEGDRIGFVALEDLLEQVIGEFDDETDPIPVGRRMR